jgi:hypothetical protein
MICSWLQITNFWDSLSGETYGTTRHTYVNNWPRKLEYLLLINGSYR